MPRATMSQPGSVSTPVSVANGDFGSRFPWYVDGIKLKVSQNWIRGQVDPRHCAHRGDRLDGTHHPRTALSESITSEAMTPSAP